MTESSSAPVTAPATASATGAAPGDIPVEEFTRYAHQLDSALGMFKARLDDGDRAAIDAVLARRQGPRGDTYTLERDREGPHGRIMKYNLNKD